MAAENYITIDTGTPMGALAVAVHDRIIDLLNLTEQLGEALGQAAADDPTNEKLRGVVGAATADNADAVKALIGSLRGDLNDSGSAFLQYAARINRSGF